MNMSSRPSVASNKMEDNLPPWIEDMLGVKLPPEDGIVDIAGKKFIRQGGILREELLYSGTQQQTSDTFGFKWQKRDTFESTSSLARMRNWLVKRYGDVGKAQWWSEYQAPPLLVDAGCGAAMSSLELFGEIIQDLRYLGVDISQAVNVAASRFQERGLEGAFLQTDISDLPLPGDSVDVIFSEGVLHHTDSTERALKSLATKLRPGGRFLFYVYNKKGPIREFTDDHIRNILQKMSQADGWDAIMPLTKFGNYLGELDIEIDVPEAIDLLGIPAGSVNLQRLFYYYIFKAFYHPDLTLEEMNHINFDWYAPANAHRQTVEEVRQWCAEAGLEIEHEDIEPSGITVIARKVGKGKVT